MAALALPDSLSHLSVYATRGKQLQGQDNVAAYWCFYHILSTVLSQGVDDASVRQYLVALMDDVEKLKSLLADNAAASDDAAARKYMFNLAITVFAKADRADRIQPSMEAAKAFKTAADFLDVYLGIFGGKKGKEAKKKAGSGEEDVEEEDEEEEDADPFEKQAREKTRYAKWRAMLIVKAVKTGKKPPAPPETTVNELDELSKVGTPTEAENAELEQYASKTTTAAVAAPRDNEEDKEVSSQLLPKTGESNTDNDIPTLPSAPTEITNRNRPSPPPSPPSLDLNSIPSAPPVPAPSVPPAVIVSPQSPRSNTAKSSIEDDEDMSDIPLASTYFASLSSSQSNGDNPEATTPLDPNVVASAQKHAKWAASALTYEDLDAAIENLTKAADMITQLKMSRRA